MIRALFKINAHLFFPSIVARFTEELPECHLVLETNNSEHVYIFIVNPVQPPELQPAMRS